jgi:hypothetical protein
MNPRDDEHPAITNLWVPKSACDHINTPLAFWGIFEEACLDKTPWLAHCLGCGSTWDQNKHEGAPYDRLLQRIAEGSFHVMDPEKVDEVEWKRQTRYDAIMADMTGTSNPILDSTVTLKPFD